MRICDNCGTGENVKFWQVGPEKGHQRDPYRDTIDLCLPCQNWLSAGDFDSLAARRTAQPE